MYIKISLYILLQYRVLHFNDTNGMCYSIMHVNRLPLFGRLKQRDNTLVKCVPWNMSGRPVAERATERTAAKGVYS